MSWRNYFVDNFLDFTLENHSLIRFLIEINLSPLSRFNSCFFFTSIFHRLIHSIGYHLSSLCAKSQRSSQINLNLSALFTAQHKTLVATAFTVALHKSEEFRELHKRAYGKSTTILVDFKMQTERSTLSYGMFNPTAKITNYVSCSLLLLPPAVVSKWCSLIFFRHPLSFSLPRRCLGKEVSTVPDVREDFAFDGREKWKSRESLGMKTLLSASLSRMLSSPPHLGC